MRSLKGTFPWKIAYVANVVARNTKTLLIEKGQVRSAWRFESVGGDGSPLPWLTFPAISFLATLDLTGARVLEYGSGASTEYWAARVEEVCSVEGDADWAQRVSARGLRNAHLTVPAGAHDYAAAGRSFGGDFDVVVVDGIERIDCAHEALRLAKHDGIIVLDNSDVHPEARAVLAADDRFLPIDFEGFGPINGYTHVTTVFVSRTASRLR